MSDDNTPRSVVSYGIKLVAHGRTGPEIEPTEWLYAFDPDGGDENIAYPTGTVESGDDPAKAFRFATAKEAAALFRLESTRTPVRPDGRPNRPLTAFTVEITKLPE